MNTTERIRQYFRVKAKQIATLAELSICEHPSLVGGHREELQRIYFREILPERFKVGRGMVYGFSGRSQEADIVIWDAANFPCLPLTDHAFFFAESVKCILECKSNYSSEEWNDVMRKCDAATGVMSLPAFGLKEQLDEIRQELISLRQGIKHDGAIVVPSRIASATLFLKGGQTFDRHIAEGHQLEIQEKWPEILLLLEPGIVVEKVEEAGEGGGGIGRLRFYKVGEDALLLFTHLLLGHITERSETLMPVLNLLRYAQAANIFKPSDIMDFPLVGMPAQRKPLWRKQPSNLT